MTISSVARHVSTLQGLRALSRSLQHETVSFFMTPVSPLQAAVTCHSLDLSNGVQGIVVSAV